MPQGDYTSMRSNLGAARQTSDQITAKVRERTVGYIAAGLGVVAGLAWNDAIVAFIEQVFPFEGNTVVAKFVYAVLITIVVVVLTTYLMRLFKKQEEAEGSSK
jgi:FtsH-binding integral membrane protein